MKDIKISSNRRYDRISSYYLTNKTLVGFLCVAGLLFDGLMSFIPTYLGKIIDMVVANDAFSVILTNGLLFIGLVLFIQVNRFIKRYLVRMFANRMTFVMRKLSFNYILRSKAEILSAHSKGDILNRNLTDIADAVEGIRKITTEVFDTFVLLLGYVISLSVMDYRLTLISMIFIFVSIFIAQFIKKAVYWSVRNYKQFLSKTKDTILTLLKNETYYRGLGVSPYYQRHFEAEQNKLESFSVRTLLYKSSLQPLYLIIVWLALIPVIWIGGRNVISQAWDIGVFSAYLTTYMLVATKASNVSKLVNAYQGLKVSWDRCKIYLSKPSESGFDINITDDGLKVRNLSFGFSKQSMFSAVSFEADNGMYIGVCGKVHSGKSSLLQALNGLYSYKGSAVLGGQELSKIRASGEKGIIGFCSSSSQIFTDSIRKNIELGRIGNIEDAIYVADIEKDIAMKKEGEEEMLTRSVANLSGGQQKRLMIARACFGKPRLVLLDNPFEAIDESTSAEILDRIKQRLPKSIVIYVSNQINILKKADKLLFLSNNSAVFGTYDSLLSNELFSAFAGGKAK